MAHNINNSSIHYKALKNDFAICTFYKVNITEMGCWDSMYLYNTTNGLTKKFL